MHAHKTIEEHRHFQAIDVDEVRFCCDLVVYFVKSGVDSFHRLESVRSETDPGTNLREGESSFIKMWLEWRQLQ